MGKDNRLYVRHGKGKVCLLMSNGCLIKLIA